MLVAGEVVVCEEVTSLLVASREPMQVQAPCAITTLALVLTVTHNVKGIFQREF